MTRAPVELATAEGEPRVAAERAGLVINVLATGAYVVENRDVTLDTLTAMIGAEVDKAGGPGAVEVLVRADRGADLRSLNALADRLIGMDLRRWRLATEVPAPGTGGGVGGGGGAP